MCIVITVIILSAFYLSVLIVKDKLVLNLCPLLSMGHMCTLSGGMWWLLCPSEMHPNVSICILFRMHYGKFQPRAPKNRDAGNCIIGCFYLWCNHPVDAEESNMLRLLCGMRLTDNHTTDVSAIMNLLFCSGEVPHWVLLTREEQPILPVEPVSLW